ncbi:MAG: sulfatase-like hydrolase/transferase [Bacteroidales bacterium]|nr:sulfatase-like hydrolase/transferase [Bacteroidales bacterium]
MPRTSKIIYFLKYILKIHLTALFFLTVVRIMFVAVNFPSDAPFVFSDLVHALTIGVKFDNHGASYIALIPLFTAFVVCFLKNVYPQKIINFFKGYFVTVYPLVLFLSVSNVKYYSFFGWHINYEALGYLKFFGTTAGMIFEDGQNYPYIIVALSVCVAFVFAVKRITQKHTAEIVEIQDPKRRIVFNSLMIIFAAGICFIGMRGSFQRYVLKVSFASFSDIPFYNRIGNNALFNIIETYKQTAKDVDIQLLKDAELNHALDFVRKELSIPTVDTLKPLSRHIEKMEKASSPNVVLVLMESMTLRNLNYETNGMPLTPFLRSLRDSAYYFENFYSAGIHTNNGICACMYGFTPNFLTPCMNQPSDIYTGLPYELKRHGYGTYTFVTSNPQFDNMNSFLRDNNIDVIYSQYDYPQEKVVNRFGVRDDYMFDFGIEKLSMLKDKPFFAMFLTCSNHYPFAIPEEYSERSEIVDEQAIAYADDALKMFFEKAVNTEWGKNTIFVFVADHGSKRGENIYDMAYYYNRIPCYVYSELFAGKMRRMDKIGGQIDLFPTIMGLLGHDYTNNTLGIDLFKTERRYIYFVSDEHLGCADYEYFYCYNIATEKNFLYKIGSGEDIILQNPEKAADMKKYAVSMMKINNTAVKKRWINP